MRKLIIKILSTFFYVGYLPFAPGTFASIIGVGLFCLMKGRGVLYVASTFILIILGLLITTEAEKIFDKKDAGCIVIDEVAGMLIAFMAVPYDATFIIITFIIFRMLDILKPYPAGLLQNLKGGLGVMGDDIAAGLYTNIIIQAVLRLTSLSAS